MICRVTFNVYVIVNNRIRGYFPMMVGSKAKRFVCAWWGWGWGWSGRLAGYWGRRMVLYVGICTTLGIRVFKGLLLITSPTEPAGGKNLSLNSLKTS